MPPPFLIGESLRFGWHKTREYNGLLFKVVLTLFAVQLLYSFVQKYLLHTVAGGIALVLLGIVGLVLGVGFAVITLKIAQGEPASFADIVPPLRIVWQYAVASIVAGLLIVAGLILFIIPGIYLAARYSMVRFAVLGGTGIRNSLRTSGAITRGAKWRLLGFLLVVIGINIVGVLCLLVGLLVTIPMSMVAYAHVYQKLLARKDVDA